MSTHVIYVGEEWVLAASENSQTFFMTLPAEPTYAIDEDYLEVAVTDDDTTPPDVIAGHRMSVNMGIHRALLGSGAIWVRLTPDVWRRISPHNRTQIIPVVVTSNITTVPQCDWLLAHGYWDNSGTWCNDATWSV